MSWTTCARSGGAVLYRALTEREAYFPLAEMQRDQDALAVNPHTSWRVHGQMIERARRQAIKAPCASS